MKEKETKTEKELKEQGKARVLQALDELALFIAELIAREKSR